VALAKTIISRLEWTVGEIVLEPCKGEGAFFDHLPPQVVKEWCEIRQGRDFFQFNDPVDTVITNPPYRDNAMGRNLVIPFLEHSFRLARRRVIILINLKTLNSLTPHRLRQYSRNGWAVTKIHVYSVKKWFGRYYLVVFEKHATSILYWDTRTY